MALDTNLRMHNANLSMTNALNGFGTNVTIGRTGVPQGGQFITCINAAPVSKTLRLDLLVSVDGNAQNGRVVARHEYPAGFAGQQVSEIGLDINPQEYTDAQVVATVYYSTPSANDANVQTVGLVSAFIGSGEGRTFGRKAGASDALVTP